MKLIVPTIHSQAGTFASFFHEQTKSAPRRRLPQGECTTPDGTKCTLCSASFLDYPDEVKSKQTAIEKFWHHHKLPEVQRQFISSPLGRGYRTVSKRKAFSVKGKPRFGLIGIDRTFSDEFPLAVGRCAIEPHSHNDVYLAVKKYFADADHARLARDFNFIISKGNDRETIVIFNMNEFSHRNRHDVNTLSKYISKNVPTVKGIHIVIDDERGNYYLPSFEEIKPGMPKIRAQKLFGIQSLSHTVGSLRFIYSPLSFSQTNHSILHPLVTTAGELLHLGKEDHLFDFYCGYGLFSLSLGKEVKHVTAIDASQSSITDGVANAKRLMIKNCTFQRSDISMETLPNNIAENRKALKIILDPPRGGTKKGVIQYIASLSPEKVVHIFCDIDLMPLELKRWEETGYTVKQVTFFDMFPGTAEVETMVLLGK
jgi:tRNA/tmRNA/rRNA uracil-C5-methylase (TrmA/RlmC/RlmD family)